MARIQSGLFQLAVGSAECWKCHKEARVVAPIASIGSVAIDDEDDDEDSPGPLVVNEATVLMDVETMSAELATRARSAVPTFRPDFSNTLGAGYWMNHCQHCGAKMGDFFLHMEPDGPFFGWPSSSANGAVLDLVGGEIVCGTMPYIEPPPVRRKRAKTKP